MNDFQAMVILSISITCGIGVYVVALWYSIPRLTQSSRRRTLAMIAILAAGAFLGLILGVAGIVIDIALLGAEGNPTTILVGCMCIIALLSTFIVAAKRASLPQEQFRERNN